MSNAMGIIRPLERADQCLRVCSYEDRPVAMDGLILMGESLCRVDPEVSLHLTVPGAPASVQAWPERRPEVVLSTRPPEGVSGWEVLAVAPGAERGPAGCAGKYHRDRASYLRQL